MAANYGQRIVLGTKSIDLRENNKVLGLRVLIAN